MKKIAVTVAFVCLSFGVSFAETDLCYEYQKNRDTADKAIRACSEDIQRGRFTGKDLATRYVNRGSAYISKGDYDRAIMDLNKAIEIEPKGEYVYLRVIIAAQNISSDSYKSSQEKLRQFIAINPSTEWVRTISRYYLAIDGLTEEAVLNRAQTGKNEREIKEQLFEAYYYLGEERLYQGDKLGAMDFFQKSINTEIINFIEHQQSRINLNRLKGGG